MKEKTLRILLTRYISNSANFTATKRSRYGIKNFLSRMSAICLILNQISWKSVHWDKRYYA